VLKLPSVHQLKLVANTDVRSGIKPAGTEIESHASRPQAKLNSRLAPYGTAVVTTAADLIARRDN
jgi:hypothetical protein